MTTKKEGILERLAKYPVIGDGSMCMVLEKRGYCRAGAWTPEAVLMYPEAVRQLLREYLRAGADVIQTPCFYVRDGIMTSNYNGKDHTFTTYEINEAACKMAKEVANEGDAVTCGGLCPVRYTGRNLEVVKKEFEKQLQPFIDNDIDFVLAEFFAYIDEVELCIEVMKKANKPIGATMRIGPMGDHNGVSVEECAVRMAKAGADIIGINCLYDVNTQLKVLKRMKAALDKEGLKPYLIVQILGWLAPEVEDELDGYLALPESPFDLDSRVLTRTEAAKFARACYELGVHYIGGCCGVEPHHIRALSQELQPERGIVPPTNDMTPAYSKHMAESEMKRYRFKANNKDFFWNLTPGTGRPMNPAFSDIAKFDEKVEAALK